MQTVYYSLMPKLLPFLPLLCIVAFAQAPEAQQAAKLHAPYSDSHEGMGIGVDPWLTASRYKQKFPKKSPFQSGIVALDVSFRNDNPKGVRVSLQRIRLILQMDEDNRQELEPLSPEDVADLVFLKKSTKDPTARHIPLPIPSIGAGPKTGKDPQWTALRDACQNAGMPSNVIGAHDTVEGLMYFDLRGEVDLLEKARLYVPNLVTMDNNEPISFFEIELGHTTSASQQ
jgi:hypothetical protein